MNVEVVRLDATSFARAVGELAELLVDAVAGGASVGFLPPFGLAQATAWWHTLQQDVARGAIVVLAARAGGGIVGTAQLRLAQLPNARHRAEVAKVLVHRSARRRGIARALMNELDRIARAEARSLLVLDTLTGSEGERLYEALGWTKAAVIPDYAMYSDEGLRPTTIFYRLLA